MKVNQIAILIAVASFPGASAFASPINKDVVSRWRADSRHISPFALIFSSFNPLRKIFTTALSYEDCSIRVPLGPKSQGHRNCSFHGGKLLTIVNQPKYFLDFNSLFAILSFIGCCRSCWSPRTRTRTRKELGKKGLWYVRQSCWCRYNSLSCLDCVVHWHCFEVTSIFHLVHHRVFHCCIGSFDAFYGNHFDPTRFHRCIQGTNICRYAILTLLRHDAAIGSWIGKGIWYGSCLACRYGTCWKYQWRTSL